MGQVPSIRDEIKEIFNSPLERGWGGVKEPPPQKTYSHLFRILGTNVWLIGFINSITP